MTSHHPSNAKNGTDPLPQLVLFVLRHDETRQPSLDRLQHLLFLVDREHARAFATVLTFLPWVREPSGPRTHALQPVLHELDHAGQLPAGLLTPETPHRYIAEAQANYEPGQPGRFSPRAARSLQHVLWRYAGATDDHIREEIDSTHAYQVTQIGEQIDLSGERAWLIEKVRQQGTDRRSWGDPEESAREDEEIMDALAGWRAEANRELLNE